MAAAILALSGCDRPSDPPPSSVTPAPASVMGQIVGANVTWGDALVRGDAETLISAYTLDAAYMTDSGDVKGPAAIRDWLLRRRAGMSDSLHATRTETSQLDVAGDRAYEAGTLTYTMVSRGKPGPTRDTTVRYVTFWLRSPQGHWQMVRSLRPLP